MPFPSQGRTPFFVVLNLSAKVRTRPSTSRYETRQCELFRSAGQVVATTCTMEVHQRGGSVLGSVNLHKTFQRISKYGKMQRPTWRIVFFTYLLYTCIT